MAHIIEEKVKTIFDSATRNEIIQRIGLLNEHSQPAWGKMNIYQMLKHCRIWSDWIHGKAEFEKHIYKQDLLGKLFGKMALKKTVKDSTPMGKSLPAGFLAVRDKQPCAIDMEKSKWIESVKDYEGFSNERFRHDFFGEMTKEQIGVLAYKHFDHHLRQFGF